MDLIRKLFFLFSITALAVASTAVSIFNYNPFVSSPAQFANFYISFFVAVAGVTTCILFYIKTKIMTVAEEQHFWPSLRQGIFLSACATALLYLRGMRLLDWWIAASSVIITVLLEAYFQTKQK
ncbi:MAG: hypothetical protein WCG48_03555 [Candidatus Berkelbacteria bacterium]